jgi:hypothetical protein
LPQTSYAPSLSVGATETVSLGTNQNGNAAITIGGTKTTGDILTITVSNLQLSGGQTQISYTVLAGDTLSTIASAIASAVSSSVSLQGIGVSATSSGTTINTTMTGSTYTASTSGGATETLALGSNIQGNSTVAVGGSVTTGNTLTLTVHSPTLPSGQKSVTYTVLGTDTLVTIAAGLSAAINADTSLQTLGLTSTNSSAATLVFSQSFVGTRALPYGASTASVSAVDGANNTKTNGYAMSVNGGSTMNLTFDLNGNMTSDGTNSYSWDAENRMTKITYSGTNNFSTFVYDGLSRNVSIVETTAGSVTSTKQFVWSASSRREERDALGALTKKFFDCGQMNSTTKYFYTCPLGDLNFHQISCKFCPLGSHESGGTIIYQRLIESIMLCNGSNETQSQSNSRSFGHTHANFGVGELGSNSAKSDFLIQLLGSSKSISACGFAISMSIAFFK